MISTRSRAFASSARTVDSLTSRASWAPSAVTGALVPLDVSVADGRNCDGFVLVTSWNRDDVSARRPEPWQLGHDAVLPPRAFPMRPSPPHNRQTSPSMENHLYRAQLGCPHSETCSTDPRRALGPAPDVTLSARERASARAGVETCYGGRRARPVPDRSPEICVACPIEITIVQTGNQDALRGWSSLWAGTARPVRAAGAVARVR